MDRGPGDGEQRTVAERIAGDRLLLLAACVSLLAVAAAAWFVANSGLLSWNDGCGDDGRFYCGMVEGEKAPIPTNRRILFPLIIRILPVPSDLIPEVSRILNLAFTALTYGAIALLTGRICDRFGVGKDRKLGAMILAAAFISLSPISFRPAYFNGIWTDPLANLLGLGWFITSTSKGKVRWWAIPLAALAALTREQWLFLILLTSLVQILVERKRDRLLTSGGCIAAVVVAGGIAFAAPHEGDLYGMGLIAFARSIVFDFFLADLRGVAVGGWMTLFALGLTPLLLVTFWRPTRELLAADRIANPPIFIPALAVVGVVLASAPLGFDLHRNLSLTLPFLLPFAFALAARNPDRDAEVAAVIAGTILVWRPFHVVDGSREDYLMFWELFAIQGSFLRDRIMADLALVAGPFMGWATLAFLRIKGVSGPSERAHRDDLVPTPPSS